MPMKNVPVFGKPMHDFARDVFKIACEQPDFRGVGGHGLEGDERHPLHTQLNVGLGRKTVPLRFSWEEPKKEEFKLPDLPSIRHKPSRELGVKPSFEINVDLPEPWSAMTKAKTRSSSFHHSLLDLSDTPKPDTGYGYSPPVSSWERKQSLGCDYEHPEGADPGRIERAMMPKYKLERLESCPPLAGVYVPPRTLNPRPASEFMVRGAV